MNNHLNQSPPIRGRLKTYALGLCKTFWQQKAELLEGVNISPTIKTGGSLPVDQSMPVVIY